MSNTSEKLHTLIDQLSPQDQQQVLKMIEELAQTDQKRPSLSKLPPGSALTRFTSSPEDAEAMEHAINSEPDQIYQQSSSKLPPGTSGKALLALKFSMSPEDIDSMEKAIEDCERIEPDEDWLSA